MARKNELYKLKDAPFSNENQKQAAILISQILLESGLSQKEFAEKTRISLATLTNVFRPNYNKTPSIALIRKIAEQTDEPEVSYNLLMDAAGYEIASYPYEYASRTESIKIPNERILLDFSSTVSTMNTHGRIAYDYNIGKSYRIDMLIDYSGTDAPIDYWAIDVKDTSSLGLYDNVIKECLYRALTSEISSEKTKFSFILTSKGVFDKLSSLCLPTLHQYVSAILYENGSFKEKNVPTGLPHETLDSAGLSL